MIGVAPLGSIFGAILAGDEEGQCVILKSTGFEAIGQFEPITLADVHVGREYFSGPVRASRKRDDAQAERTEQ